MLRALAAALVCAALVAGSSARGAEASGLSGAWMAPFGALDVVQSSDRVVASPRGKSGCSAPSSNHLLEGDLLEDSLSGQLFVCLSGCDRGPTWVPVLLLVSPDGKSLSGTSTLPRGCTAPLGPHGSLVLHRAAGGELAVVDRPSPPESSDAPSAATAGPKAKPSAPASDARVRKTASGAAASHPALAAAARPTESPQARERALELARDGLSFQQEGKFEQARRRFQQAIEIDPLYAEGYNGVGVTFFARNDYPEALRWYKRALGADPAFGDAYYNMACVYALQRRSALALRYLRTAFHNGYTSRQTMREDPDLASLHSDPSFEALLSEPE